MPARQESDWHGLRQKDGFLFVVRSGALEAAEMRSLQAQGLLLAGLPAEGLA
jgi:hypothetical protein